MGHFLNWFCACSAVPFFGVAAVVAADGDLHGPYAADLHERRRQAIFQNPRAFLPRLQTQAFA